MSESFRLRVRCARMFHDRWQKRWDKFSYFRQSGFQFGWNWDLKSISVSIDFSLPKVCSEVPRNVCNQVPREVCENVPKQVIIIITIITIITIIIMIKLIFILRNKADNERYLATGLRPSWAPKVPRHPKRDLRSGERSVMTMVTTLVTMMTKIMTMMRDKNAKMVRHTRAVCDRVNDRWWQW